MFDADDDNFYTDDSDLGIDNDPGLIGDAKMSLLTSMERIVTSMKKNVQFNEDGDFQANLNCLSSFVSHLVDLQSLQDSEESYSNEELMDKIQAIVRETTVLTMSNIDSIIPEEEEGNSVSAGPSDEAGTDW